MKQILLFLFSLVVVTGFAQTPQITVSKSAINATTTTGGTTTQTFTITNTGNRDLTWSLATKGAPVTFTKASYADWTLPSNQDRVSPSVWITRKHNQGIFNIAQESGFTSASPLNTEWAFGKTEDMSEDDYSNWQAAVDGDPQSMVDEVISMHIISENRYFDVEFHSFSGSNTGGGFSYTRTEIGLQWIGSDALSGTLIPGQSKTVTITFDAEDLSEATHAGEIIITSNDAAKEETKIAVTLNVTDGDATPDISAAASKNFGNGYVNYNVDTKIGINNVGNGVLNVTSVTSSNPVFIPQITSFTVAPGLGFDLPVRFSPTALGNFTATLTITSNDPDEATITINVSGAALGAPVLATTGNFTKTAISGNEAYEQLTLTNNGTSDLTYTIEMQLGVGNTVTFEKKNYASPALPENQDRISNNVHLTRADERGLFNAVVESSHNTSISPTNTTWSPLPTLQADGYTNWRTALDSDIPDFVDVTTSMFIPAENRYFDVTLKQWTCCERGGGFRYTRTEVYNWVVASPAEGTVTAGNTAYVDVDFTTVGLPAGTYTGKMVIRSNDPATPVKEIPVSLTITGSPIAALYETSLSLGNVAPGNFATTKFRILNNGVAPLSINSIVSSNPAVTLNTTSTTIAPFSMAVVEATFRPTLLGVQAGTITLTTNDDANPQLTLDFTAEGVAPGDVNIVATDVNATVETGSTVTKTFTIQNTGAGTLHWTLGIVNNNPVVAFSKEDYADWKLAANQDRLSEKIWITRADTRGIFNAAIESSYQEDESPVGTEWQYGPTLMAEYDWYSDWESAIDGDPLAAIDQTYSLHAANEYYDIVVRSWTSNGQGGGFSYERKKAAGWIKASAFNGTVSGSDEVVVTLTYDPRDYVSGTHNEVLVITSDDPDEPSIQIPIQLIIQGKPTLDASVSSLDFGDTGFGHNKVRTITLYNEGTDVLNVSNIASTNAAFTVNATSMTIPVGGSQTFNVTFTPGAIQSYTGSIQITSDASDESGFTIALTGAGIQVPDIAVTPASITDLTPSSPVKTGTITIENSGVASLNWVTAKPSAYPLDQIMANLNETYTDITSLIPGKYTFNYDGGSNYINDGGNDMYDNGNVIETNLLSSIAYSNNVIADGTSAFGAGSSYFTRHLPGLFVMVADLNGVNTFTVTGNNGADGMGSMDATVLTTTQNGVTYKGFLKRVYGTSDPSINQLVIIENSASASHTYATNTDNTHHEVSGLSETSRIFYLLYAGTSGGYINNDQATAIMQEFIASISGGNGFLPDWITLDAYSGTVAPSTTQTINYTIDLSSMPSADYQGNIAFFSNDPDENPVLLPVRMNLGSVVVINPITDIVVNEGFGTRTVNFGAVFVDGNNDALSYAVGTDLGIVTGSIAGTTLTLTETGTGTGTSIVSVRADDGNNNVAFADFNFRVNDIPNVANPITDQEIVRFSSVATLDITNVFIDTDEQDELTFSVTNSNDAVATASLINGVVSITNHAVGSTTVTVTVNDGSGGVTTDSFVVNVSKAPATVTLAGITATYDGTQKVVTASTTPANLVVNIAYTLNGNAVASPVNAGTYQVTATIADANYQGSQTGTLTITKADQTITFASLSNVFNSVTTVALSATSTSGLAVSFSVTNGPATVSGTTLTLNGEVGTVTINANQAGNENYNAAAVVTRTLVVDQDPILGADDPLQASVSVFPVPASLNITIETGTYTIKQVALVDGMGRIQYSAQPLTSSHVIAVSSFANGIYLLKVTTERGTVVRRVQVGK